MTTFGKTITQSDAENLLCESAEAIADSIDCGSYVVHKIGCTDVEKGRGPCKLLIIPVAGAPCLIEALSLG